MGDDIIDLNAERNKREQPDPEFVRKDGFGRPLYLFLLNYQMDGASYTADIWAYDMADAQRRVDAISTTVAVLGQAFGKEPA